MMPTVRGSAPMTELLGVAPAPARFIPPVQPPGRRFAAVFVVILLGISLVACQRFVRPLSIATLNEQRLPTGISQPSTVQLHNGVKTVESDGIALTFRAIKHAFSDIDNDGDTDAALVMQAEARPAGSTSNPGAPGPDNVTVSTGASLIVVRNENGQPRALPPAPLGSSVQLDKLALHPTSAGGKAKPARGGIVPAHVRVAYHTRSTAIAPYDTSHTQVFSIEKNRLHGGGNKKSAVEGLPAPSVPAALDGALGTATRTGVISFGATAPYLVHGEEGQRLETELNTDSDDAALAVFGADGTTLLSVSARSQATGMYLPTTQAYYVAVVSGQKPALYTVKTTVKAKPAAPPTGDKVLRLTFDDGPSTATTPAILDLLRQYNAPSTFFMIGKNAAPHPDLVEQVRAAGHTLGNHSYTHTDMREMSKEKFDSEVDKTQTTLRQGASSCLRPPYGATDANTAPRAAAKGLKLAMWTIDTLDWKKPGADAIANTVITQAKPGSVVLMHDGGDDRSQTVTALERILRELTAQGWRFATLDC